MVKKAKDNKINFVYGITPEEDAYYKSVVKVKDEGSLSKSILNVLNGPDNAIERLAFETDPTQYNTYAGIYKQKMRLLPDAVLKRIAIQDSLVSNIVRARQNHVSSFGRPRPDRFSTGYIIRPNAGVTDGMDDAEKQKLAEKIQKAINLFATCGHTAGIKEHHQKTFAEYLSLVARDSQVVGRIATEIVRTDDLRTDEKRFHYFCHTDAGTIYPAAADNESAKQAIRDEAFALIQSVTGRKDLVRENWNKNNEYVWVQVIDGRPFEVFTTHEMKCWNFYPVGNVELDGFPVTPIDTVISAITTHLNITTHNKVYFQNGRATRGMLVIKSDDVNPTLIHNIKQQFNASINNAGNSWRMPVMGFNSDAEIDWKPIDSSGSRDMEFQYLTDLNAREILTAFMMSPDELPGWSYLSRGTNSQALSECISPDTRILTSEGLVAVEKIVGCEKEKPVTIWNGENWAKGRAFRSGKKKLVETTLSGGYEIKTSPDHRFRVLGKTGDLVWKHQFELLVGDNVLVNKIPVEGSVDVPAYKGKPLTLEMMEILGWITGDGTLSAPGARCGAKIYLFYHPSKERDLWEHHANVMRDFGLNPKQKEKFLTEEKRTDICEKRGFNSCSANEINTCLYDTDFYRWLISLGFTSSNKKEGGKSIPSVLHVLPIEYRQAFLRGLFSADGGKLNETGHVALTIQNLRLRDQVRQLLLSLGIRTLPAKGYLRKTFDGKKSFSNKLFIKDRREFWEQIGFCQSFKKLDGAAQKWSCGNPPLGFIQKVLLGFKETEFFKTSGKRTRDNIIFVNNGDRPCSWMWLIETVKKCGLEIPNWFNKYSIELVREIKDLNSTIEMFDVETYDEAHQFLAEGIVTHNSNGEFKIEAARDVGIRPLLAGLEEYVNKELFPLIDAELAKTCRFVFAGLDADSPEKEIVNIQQNSQVWMSYNDILEKVERKLIPKECGGELPLNPSFGKMLDAYFTVGQILEFWCGVKDASKDPSLQYRRDPMWFQNVQLMMQQQQMQDQQQQMQQQAQMQAQQPNQGQGQGQGQQESNAANQEQAADPTDLSRSIDQAYELMSKSEANMTPNQRKLLHQQQKTVKWLTKGFEDDMEDAVAEILEVAKQIEPKK